MIVAGNTLIVTFANQSSKTYSGGELFDLYKTKTFIIYFITLAGLLIVLQILYKRLVKHRRHNPHLIPFIYAMVCTRPLAHPSMRSFDDVGAWKVSGIIGTQSVLLAKSVSTLLRTTLAGNNQLGSPFLYVVLVAWAVTMVFWLYRMNKALIKFDGVFIIPMLQVRTILVVIASSVGGNHVVGSGCMDPILGVGRWNLLPGICRTQCICFCFFQQWCRFGYVRGLLFRYCLVRYHVRLLSFSSLFSQTVNRVSSSQYRFSLL